MEPLRGCKAADRCFQGALLSSRVSLAKEARRLLKAQSIMDLLRSIHRNPMPRTEQRHPRLVNLRSQRMLGRTPKFLGHMKSGRNANKTPNRKRSCPDKVRCRQHELVDQQGFAVLRESATFSGAVHQLHLAHRIKAAPLVVSEHLDMGQTGRALE